MDLTEDILFIVNTVWFFLAAYLANAAPVIFGGGAPLDGGRLFIEGKPLLGSHKTKRGAAAGILTGFITGLAQMDPLRGFLLGLGAILGDLANSFAKRRLDLKPGAQLPAFDQLSFIFGATALVSLVPPHPTGKMIATIVVATVPIHYVSNLFAYLMRMKSRPW